MKLSSLISNSIRLVAFGLSLASLAAVANSAQAVYGVNSNKQFGVVNLASGGFHAIGAPTPEGQANLV